MGNLDGIVLDGREAFHPFCNIRHVPQSIFHILSGFIGNIGKQAECCNIYKRVLIKRSHITGKNPAIDYNICRCFHIFRNIEGAGKIVGAARRYIADGNSFLTLHHSCGNLIQRSVTATAHQQIKTGMPLFHSPDRIARSLGRVCCHFIACLYKGINDIQQITANLFLSRLGIIDEQ